MVMSADELRGFLEEELPSRFWPIFHRVHKKTFNDVKVTADNNPYLNSVLAKVSRGYNELWAMWENLINEVKADNLPLGLEICPYPNQTGTYLKLKTKNCDIVIVRTKREREFPRKAKHRDIQRRNNQELDSHEQLALIFDDSLDRPREKRYLLIISFGEKHIKIGIPHSIDKDWSYQSQNLRDLPYIVESNDVEGLRIRPAEKVKLKPQRNQAKMEGTNAKPADKVKLKKTQKDNSKKAKEAEQLSSE